MIRSVTDHSECRHSPSKRARTSCRYVARMLDYARAMGLTVEECSDGVLANQRQFWIKVNDDWTSSKLLITQGDTVDVMHCVLTKSERITLKNLRSWIAAIAPHKEN